MHRTFFYRNMAICSSLALTACAGSPVAPPMTGNNSIVQQQQEPSVVNADRHVLAKAAASAGVRSCVERIDQVGKFLTSNSQAGAHLFAPDREANQHIFSTSLEVITNTISSYASASFAASANGGCDGMYESIAYWGNKCDDVGAKAFAAFKEVAPLKTTIRSLDGGKNVRVYLMPAGGGCISIKKELIY